MSTVTLTQEAVDLLDKLIDGEPLVWVLMVVWKKGSADLRRTKEGGVEWEREPDAGWTVYSEGHYPNALPSDYGVPIYKDVRLFLVDRSPFGPFPGGEIAVVNGSLALRVRE